MLTYSALVRSLASQTPAKGALINPEGKPYLLINAPLAGVCDANDRTKAEYVNNPSRLDFLLPDNFDGTLPPCSR